MGKVREQPLLPSPQHHLERCQRERDALLAQPFTPARSRRVELIDGRTDSIWASLDTGVARSYGERTPTVDRP